MNETSLHIAPARITGVRVKLFRAWFFGTDLDNFTLTPEYFTCCANTEGDGIEFRPRIP